VGLIHVTDETVDLVLPVAIVTALDEMIALFAIAPAGTAELERPEEVVGLLEVWPDREDLVDEILNADDAELA